MIRLGPLDEIPVGEGRTYAVDGEMVAVFRLRDGSVRAVSAVCPHRGGPLSDGDLAGTIVACPLHGRKIELKTGKVLNDNLSCTFTFPVRVEDGSVYVEAGALTALNAPARGAGSAA